MIVVIIPTLDRAHKMRPLAENIRAATVTPVNVMFVTEGHDAASNDVAGRLVAEKLARWCINKRRKNFSGAFNDGYQVAASNSSVPFTHVFVGADDLRFEAGWDTPALELLAANPRLRVAGSNDLHNPSVLGRQMATAYLIDRRYIDEVGGVADQPPGIVQCEAYEHNYTDTEFCATAQARGVWAACLASIVEHMHPVWGRGEWDAGYARSGSGMWTDAAIFESRRHLWEGQH